MASTQPARINTLPLEILSSIFATVVNASLYARSINDDSYGLIEYPTLLSSVCAHWRRVSISTTYLWSYIDLMLENERLRNVEHIKLWLDRSQRSPLQLRLGPGGARAQESPGYYESLEEFDERLAPILVSSAPRVHSFTLKFDDPDFGGNVLACLLPAEGLHSIRELALRQSVGSLKRPQLLPANGWNRLLEPLHVLHIECTTLNLGSIPCQNLVELRLISLGGFPPLAPFLKLLELNPGLHTIVLNNVMFHNMRSSPAARPINLPSLRCVRLSMSKEFVVWFLKLLFPGVHELDLHFGYTGMREIDDTSLGDAMISFFRRTRVKSLSLQPKEISLPPILSSLPHLKHLRLVVVDFDADTLAGLDITENLLPKLHTIDLNELNLEDYSELPPELHAFLSLPSVRRIRYLNCGDWYAKGTREKFVGLLEEGGFAATIIPASRLDFEDFPSPFQ